jgi:hypothetical protein
MGSLRTCSKCRIPKDPSIKVFGKDKSRKDGLNPQCKECRTAYRKGPGSRVAKSCNLRRLYGITLEEQESIFAFQGLKCAACGSKEPRGGYWHTDHDHATGKVCGVICNKCNVLCGYADDSGDIAFGCAAYLMATRGEK